MTKQIRKDIEVLAKEKICNTTYLYGVKRTLQAYRPVICLDTETADWESAVLGFADSEWGAKQRIGKELFNHYEYSSEHSFVIYDETVQDEFERQRESKQQKLIEEQKQADELREKELELQRAKALWKEKENLTKLHKWKTKQVCIQMSDRTICTKGWYCEVLPELVIVDQRQCGLKDKYSLIGMIQITHAPSGLQLKELSKFAYKKGKLRAKAMILELYTLRYAWADPEKFTSEQKSKVKETVTEALLIHT